MNIDGVSGGVSGLPESFMYQVAQLGDYIKQTTEKTVKKVDEPKRKQTKSSILGNIDIDDE